MPLDSKLLSLPEICLSSNPEASGWVPLGKLLSQPCSTHSWQFSTPPSVANPGVTPFSKHQSNWNLDPNGRESEHGEELWEPIWKKSKDILDISEKYLSLLDNKNIRSFLEILFMAVSHMEPFC